MTLADQLAPLDDGMYSTPIPPEVKHALIECALALEVAEKDIVNLCEIGYGVQLHENDFPIRRIRAALAALEKAIAPTSKERDAP